MNRSNRTPVILAAVGALAVAACATGTDPDLPASLQDTVTDGDLHTDGSGAFVADDDTAWMFDYYLSAEGELSLPEIRERVSEEAHRRLAPAAAGAAIAKFGEYLAYRQQAARIMSSDELSPDEAIAELRRVRADTIGEDSPLAADARDLEHAARARRIVTDDRLDADERAARLRDLAREAIEERSAKEADLRARATVVTRLRRVEEALRADGAGQDAIRAARAAIVGSKAADRLAALDRRRRRFRERLTDYRRERARIAREVADPQARRDALAALRDARFGPRERARVRALDRARVADLAAE